jgi:hypothetical protein
VYDDARAAGLHGIHYLRAELQVRAHAAMCLLQVANWFPGQRFATRLI